MASDATDQPRRALSETQPEFLARAILVRGTNGQTVEDPRWPANVILTWSDEDEQRLRTLAAGSGH